MHGCVFWMPNFSYLSLQGHLILYSKPPHFNIIFQLGFISRFHHIIPDFCKKEQLMKIFNRSVLPLPWYFPFKSPSCHLLFSLIALCLSVHLGIPSSPTALTIALWHVMEGLIQVERGDIYAISLWKLSFLKTAGEHSVFTFYKTKRHFSPTCFCLVFIQILFWSLAYYRDKNCDSCLPRALSPSLQPFLTTSPNALFWSPQLGWKSKLGLKTKNSCDFWLLFLSVSRDGSIFL